MEFADFVRFTPSVGKEWGYDAYVVFEEERGEDEEKRVPKTLASQTGVKLIQGVTIRAENIPELQSKLRKVKRDEGVVVGVLSSEVKVNREAVMRRKVDILLDSPERRLDYATVMLAAEKDVIIEVSLSKFLSTKGIRRMRLFEETAQLLQVIRKFDAPFALTTAASTFYGLRQRKQVEDFFAFIGADVERARYYISRLLRRLTDERYIMDGLEIED
ncbi:RNase P subunit p30 family protein [Archaeoglobus veneficus]|uniref:Ribonuclease P protein component 3 n=1 Tax=Archaeoglobus veneficus (strain DSM 11195 / SNP6) TaxID=693661 RepID=F2KT27_ARCVS|nr:RNase P subunit p30 family protein [Archaeoglobus veneficus]AEA47057.1 Ribonuclease P protein component 3 [Archaeoglobus veneficus SNP6]